MTTLAIRIAAMANHIDPILKRGLDPMRYASGLLDDDENETGHYEIRAFDTKNGVPYTFTAADCGAGGGVATIYDHETGAEITTGLQGCHSGSTEAMQAAQAIAATRGRPVTLEDDDGEWVVQPDGSAARAEA